MAWRAYLAEPVAKDGGTNLQVVVWYYDDANPANSGVGPGPPPVPPSVVLHSAYFTIPREYTQAQIAQRIRTEGAAAREAIADASAINSSFPVGSTINIP